MNRWVGRSLRVRLALFASVAMLLLSIVVNAIVLYTLHSQTIDVRAHRVFGKAVAVLLTIRRGKLTEILYARDLDGVQVVDPAGRVAAATPNLAGLPRLTAAIPPLARPPESPSSATCRGFPASATSWSP